MTTIDYDPKIHQENLEFWRKAWDMVKTPYTQMPDLSYIARIPSDLSSLSSKADINSDKILDLGCGSGWLSIFLARQGFNVLGIDISPQAINLAQAWAKKEELEIEFRVQDISELQIENKLSAVIANSIFEHLNYSQSIATLAKIKSLLQPKGIFIGCFDIVGTGPGEYFKLEDGTQVYTDKGRKGMILRCYSNEELHKLFSDWKILDFSTVDNGTRYLLAQMNE